MLQIESAVGGMFSALRTLYANPLFYWPALTAFSFVLTLEYGRKGAAALLYLFMGIAAAGMPWLYLVLFPAK